MTRRLLRRAWMRLTPDDRVNVVILAVISVTLGALYAFRVLP